MSTPRGRGTTWQGLAEARHRQSSGTQVHEYKTHQASCNLLHSCSASTIRLPA